LLELIAHLTGIVCCLVAAVVQQHTCCIEHSQTAVCRKGRICCDISLSRFELNICPVGYAFLKEAVEVVQDWHPVIDVPL